jgi:hypothetical protein
MKNVNVKNGEFYTDELEDLYIIKYKDLNDEYKNLPISWNRNAELPSNTIRVYDIEVDDDIIFFNMIYKDNLYYFEPQSKIQMENLKNKGIYLDILI